MIPTLKSIFNFNQWKQVQQWVNNKLTLKQDIFNANNTATGGTSVTINAKSGVATFTSPISGNSISGFTINNNLVTTSTLLLISITTDYAGDGTPYYLGYQSFSGNFIVDIENISSSDTNNPIIVAFQILN